MRGILLLGVALLVGCGGPAGARTQPTGTGAASDTGTDTASDTAPLSDTDTDTNGAHTGAPTGDTGGGATPTGDTAEPPSGLVTPGCPAPFTPVPADLRVRRPVRQLAQRQPGDGLPETTEEQLVDLSTGFPIQTSYQRTGDPTPAFTSTDVRDPATGWLLEQAGHSSDTDFEAVWTYDAEGRELTQHRDAYDRSCGYRYAYDHTTTWTCPP